MSTGCLMFAFKKYTAITIYTSLMVYIFFIIAKFLVDLCGDPDCWVVFGWIIVVFGPVICVGIYLEIEKEYLKSLPVAEAVKEDGREIC